MVTNKSSTFAIRMTIGYFEFDPNTGLGVEHIGLNGEATRHRAIYFVDRSIPVGYRTGEDLNTEQTILLRRFLE
jgi:hypothetical protein